MYLREKWRIIGGLIGALPSHPRQNAQLGLPLELMPEETTLLLEMGMYSIYSRAVLLSGGNGFDRATGVLKLLEYTPTIVTEEDVKAFNEMREKDFEEQVFTP